MNEATSIKIWESLIVPYFKKCNERYGGLVCPGPGYNMFCSYYEDLLSFAKTHYMSKNVVRLNRHKVSAAIMIAILKAKPIKKIDSQFYAIDTSGKSTIWPFNEALAITVGLSVLRAFILERVDEAFIDKPVSKKIFEGVCKQDYFIFENGIPLTKKARSEWEWELYQVRQEGAYNLLAMAHILSDLEIISRLQYFCNHPDDSPQFPIYSTDEDEQQEDVSLEDVVQKM